MSDHSSLHFDSVSGTAINLGGSRGGGSCGGSTSSRGGGGGGGRGISSLAKDAKECGQPGLTRDSQITRPGLPVSAAGRVTAGQEAIFLSCSMVIARYNNDSFFSV